MNQYLECTFHYFTAGGINAKPHSLNPYENIAGSPMSGTPIRPKPTNELKAVSMSTLVPSPITPSPSLSLPPGIKDIIYYLPNVLVVILVLVCLLF